MKDPNRSHFLSASRDPFVLHFTGIGAGVVLGAGFACSIVALLFGPTQSFVGMCAGAVLGGLAGQVVAQIRESPGDDEPWHRHYTARGSNHHSTAEPVEGKTPAEELYQTPREAWIHLDESNRQLIQGPLPSEFRESERS